MSDVVSSPTRTHVRQGKFCLRVCQVVFALGSPWIEKYFLLFIHSVNLTEKLSVLNSTQNLQTGNWSTQYPCTFSEIHGKTDALCGITCN